MPRANSRSRSFFEGGRGHTGRENGRTASWLTKRRRLDTINSWVDVTVSCVRKIGEFCVFLYLAGTVFGWTCVCFLSRLRQLIGVFRHSTTITSRQSQPNHGPRKGANIGDFTRHAARVQLGEKSIEKCLPFLQCA